MDKDLIEEFYNSNPQYHFIPLKEFTIICKSPFSFTRENMKKGEDTRLKYLGHFSIVPSRLNLAIAHNQTKVKEGKMTKEYYLELIDYLTDIKNDEKIKEQIEKFIL